MLVSMISLILDACSSDSTLKQSSSCTVSKGTNRRRTHPLSLHRAFVPEETDDLDLLLDGAYGFLRPVDAVRRPREVS